MVLAAASLVEAARVEGGKKVPGSFWGRGPKSAWHLFKEDSMQLDEFTEGLQKTYGTNLISVILYGSAAGRDFHEDYSDYNIAVVLKELSLEEIGRSAKFCRKWMQKSIFSSNPLPLFIDPEYIETSSDVFPLEFLDIQENNRVLFGENVFSNIKISQENLRLECESELKSKILALRQGFLRIYPSKRKAKKMMFATSSSLFAIFRGFLRLLGEKVPATKREVLAKLNEKTKFDTAIFDKILDVREGKTKLSRSEIWTWMEEYLTTLKKMARVADTL